MGPCSSKKIILDEKKKANIYLNFFDGFNFLSKIDKKK